MGLHSAVSSGYQEPATRRQMLLIPTKERKNWEAGEQTELKNMKLKNVWDVIDRSEVPAGRRLLLCKWVYKLKRNGIYRSRLVAMSFSQIPGVDFTDSFAPVVGDVRVRILFILTMIFGWSTRLMLNKLFYMAYLIAKFICKFLRE